MPVVHLQAFAKINLFLHVGPRRPDGYHEILTLFQSISLADRIRIRMVRSAAERPAGLTLRMSDPRLPVGDQNTIRRAYRYLCARVPAACRVRFDVRVAKRIPVGTGLGGGSADAAGFLMGACRLLNVRPPTSSRDLREIARSVGADVPFCLTGGTAIGRGRGERLKSLSPLPSRRLFLVIPSARISTQEAYDRLDRAHAAKNLTRALSARSLRRVVSILRKGKSADLQVNDFQEVACRAHAELANVAGALSAFGMSAMTGSGSAFYVLPRPGVSLRKAKSTFPSVPVLESRFVRGGVRFFR